MLIQGVITVLLFINACFYLNRMLFTKRYRINEGQLTEIRVMNVSYLLLNIICMCLVLMIK